MEYTKNSKMALNAKIKYFKTIYISIISTETLASISGHTNPRTTGLKNIIFQ